MIPLLLAAALAQPADKVELLHTEVDAVVWAFTALQSYPPEDQPYVRFVYLPPWAADGNAVDRRGQAIPEWIYAVDVAVNLACGHGRQLVRGDVHAGGWILAYDFARLVPQLEDRAKVLALWDSLAIVESRFHVSNLNTGFKRTAVLAPHLQAALAKHVSDRSKDQRIDVLVTQLTSSTGGIYPADFVIEQCLWTRYQDFRLFPKGNDGKLTEVQQLLKRYGFYLEYSRNQATDKGAILIRSDVLRQGWRLAIAFFGNFSRSPALVTFDFTRDNQDPTKAPLRNLVDPFRFADATEGFIPTPNGLVTSFLANDKGELLRFAPPDVALDFNQPKAGELANAMSCWTCHGPVQGYVQPIKSITAKFLFSRADYFGEEIEFGGHKLTADEALDIVVGRFDGTFERTILPRANQDLVSAMGVLAPYPVGKENAAQRVGQKIKDIWYRFRFGAYGADELCLEAGVRVPAGRGPEVLQILLGDQPEGTIEDPLFGLILNGAYANRHDVDALNVDLLRRAVAGRERLKMMLEKGEIK